MADRCKRRVMLLGRHFQDAATQCGPEVDRFLQLDGLGALNRCQDDLAPGVQVGVGVLHAREFFARDRVGGHEQAHMLAQRTAGCVDHVAFGGAHVHDQHVGRDQMLDGLEGGLGGGDRHRDQHDVGPGDGQQRGRRFDINHAHLACPLGGAG